MPRGASRFATRRHPSGDLKRRRRFELHFGSRIRTRRWTQNSRRQSHVAHTMIKINVPLSSTTRHRPFAVRVHPFGEVSQREGPPGFSGGRFVRLAARLLAVFVIQKRQRVPSLVSNARIL